jgi:hypothetical protein
MQEKLIFVYNAESGLRNTIIDGVHKIFSPSTYACKLCEITFGAFTEKSSWKEFREETSLPMEFLHKDEFRKAYASKFGAKYNFPIVLAVNDLNLEVFIATHELNALKNPEELIRLIQSRI